VPARDGFSKWVRARAKNRPWGGRPSASRRQVFDGKRDSEFARTLGQVGSQGDSKSSATG